MFSLLWRNLYHLMGPYYVSLTVFKMALSIRPNLFVDTILQKISIGLLDFAVCTVQVHHVGVWIFSGH